jgi:AraC family transcriptional regulator
MTIGGSSRLEYEKRVNRVIDHIRDHLAEDLSLERLAQVAAFSPFHFHRVFRAITDETLFAFIQRLRLERAAVALTYRPDESVLAVALDHGFSSAATFARAFKAHFGMSAMEWRRGGAKRWSKRSKANRNPGKAPRRGRRDHARMNVTVTTLPPHRVAYMRHVGPYGALGIPGLWERFTRWMDTRGLLGADSIKLGIGHDDPEVTAPEKCRYDACVVIPESFQGDRWVNVTEAPGASMRRRSSWARPTRFATRGKRSIARGCPAAATSPTIGRASRSTAAIRTSMAVPGRSVASCACR